MTSLVPAVLPIRTAAFVAGMVDRDFRRKVIARGLVVMTLRGKVDRVSLENYLGFVVSPERYLSADRRLDDARRYQQSYRDARKLEANHAVA